MFLEQYFEWDQTQNMDPWINLLFNEFRKCYPPILYCPYYIYFSETESDNSQFLFRYKLTFYISLNGIVLKTACSTKGSRDKTTFLINKPRSRDSTQYRFPTEGFKTSHRIGNVSGTLKLFIPWKRLKQPLWHKIL